MPLATSHGAALGSGTSLTPAHRAMAPGTPRPTIKAMAPLLVAVQRARLLRLVLGGQVLPRRHGELSRLLAVVALVVAAQGQHLLPLPHGSFAHAVVTQQMEGMVEVAQATNSVWLAAAVPPFGMLAV